MNWPQFAKRILLADGRITDHEAALIRAAVEEQGAVDKETLEFLGDLKRQATSVHPTFDTFFFRVVKAVVLTDGKISDAETKWMRRAIFADHQVTAAEAKFVAELRADADGWGPEFDSLYSDCVHLHPTVFKT